MPPLCARHEPRRAAPGSKRTRSFCGHFVALHRRQGTGTRAHVAEPSPGPGLAKRSRGECDGGPVGCDVRGVCGPPGEKSEAGVPGEKSEAGVPGVSEPHGCAAWMKRQRGPYWHTPVSAKVWHCCKREVEGRKG